MCFSIEFTWVLKWDRFGINLRNMFLIIQPFNRIFQSFSLSIYFVLQCFFHIPKLVKHFEVGHFPHLQLA